MRVIGGRHRRRHLEVPALATTRPTSDRVRESLFNWLENFFQTKSLAYADLSFLDGFAGSGALGIEALSRGAHGAGFIEQNPEAYQVMKRNLARLNLEEKARPYRRDVLRPGAPHRQYDVVFLDPPYGKNLALPALRALIQQQWLEEKSIAVLEVGRKEDVCPIEGFTLLERRGYGTTQLLFLAR